MQKAGPTSLRAVGIALYTSLTLVTTIAVASGVRTARGAIDITGRYDDAAWLPWDREGAERRRAVGRVDNREERR